MKKYITCIICIVIAFFSAFSGFFGTADSTVGDILYHKPSSINGKIRIIKIDEKSLGEYGEYADWDRSVYAELVETLNVSEEIHPAVIGFDLLFESEKNNETDMRFVNA